MKSAHYRWLLVGVAAVGCGSPASTPSELSEAPLAETTPVAFNIAGSPVVEFEAPGMHCENCAASIVEAIRSKPGVVDVKADPETKVVAVAVEADVFDADAAVAAIADAGFGEATLVDDSQPAYAEGAAAVDNAG